MASKDTIVQGMRQVVVEAKRVSGVLDRLGDWETKRPQGWTPKEIFSHLASTAGIIPAMGPGMLAAPVGSDLTTNTDISQLNAQSIAAMTSMTPSQIVAVLEANYGKAMEWVQSVPGDQLDQEKTFAQANLPAGDILETIAVLHANHHLYEAAMRIAM
jgi:hypothetical protein